MFARNDKVVYPGHGVAVINDIIEKRIAGKFSSFFELRFLNKDMTILVPTDNASNVGIRRLSSIEKIHDIFEKLSQPAPAKNQETILSNWNKRNKEYQGKLRSGDIFEIGAIYRDLRHIEQYKELSFGEKNLLQQTEQLLAEEISIVNNVHVDHAIECLRVIVGHRIKHQQRYI